MENNEQDWSKSALKPGIFTGAGYDENNKLIIVKVADSFTGDDLVTRQNKKDYPNGGPEIIKI
ncbi:MAG: hypothetical protein KBB70_03125 [Candidatus Pacebacteria bacterium]|nr:hypothetical protein [Candidatus Paceibacterota bacterium]